MDGTNEMDCTIRTDGSDRTNALDRTDGTDGADRTVEKNPYGRLIPKFELTHFNKRLQLMNKNLRDNFCICVPSFEGFFTPFLI